MKFEADDYIKVKTDLDEFKGRVIPRPTLIDSDYVILKLDNGYNQGIKKNSIKSSEILKKFVPLTEKKKPLKKQNNNLPNISILSCGGTISSKVDYRTGGVYADYTADDFVAMVPKLGKIANLKARKVMGVMSEDMHYVHWKQMAEAVFEELKTADAVVITQGTDTMHYSSAMMSFFLRNINKPVIFTAAQRSIDRGSSDAFMNLLCAVKAGANFNGAGVFICMHGTSSDDYCLIQKGTKVRKMHSLRRDAFRSINEMPLAKIYPDRSEIEYINNNYEKQKSDDELKDKNILPILDTNFEEKVALVFVYPGMNPKVIDFYIDEGYKAIVLAATALGHVPSLGKCDMFPALERAKKEGVIVAVTTQCYYGRVDPLVYSPLRRLSIDKEVIFLEDMLPEVAYLKMGWVLGKVRAKGDVKKYMLENVAGEINYKRDQRSFLN